MEKKPISLTQLGKRLVMTSVTLLDNLFNDDLEKQQTIETYRSRLSEAAHDQDLVVLQLLQSLGLNKAILPSTVLISLDIATTERILGSLISF